MEKQKNTQLLIIAVLAVTVLTMSVGFAAYSANLNIVGNATIEAAQWKVEFDTESYSEKTGTGYVAATSHTLGVTDLSFAVDLEVGETYEFEATIENRGTFDAILDSFSMTTLSAEQQKYLTYEVYYGGTKMTTGTGKNISLPHGTSNTAKVKVTVAYNAPTDQADLDLIDEKQNVELTAAFGFVSAN